MRLVFLAARYPALKALALEATLVAAVGLNRYSAMNVFNRMLMAVTSVDVALPIAEMLRAHPRTYAVLADGAPADRLHPAVREVQRQLLSMADSTAPV